jgi:hypothetical protein
VAARQAAGALTMPLLSRFYIRTALLWLALGTTLGGIILWNKASPIPGAWQLLTAHITLVTWGWILQLTLGVAYWILPRVSGPRFGAERPRPWLAVAAYVLLNAALVFGAVVSLLPVPWPGILVAALELLALLLFALHAWPRVRRSAYGK